MSFRNNAILWEHAPALRALIPLIAGIILYDLGQDNNAITLQSIAIVTILVVSLPFGFYFIKRQDNMQALLVQLFFVWAGFLLSYTHDDRNSAHWMGRKTKSADYLLGIIKAPPQKKSQTLKLEITALALYGQSESVSGDALVYIYNSKMAESPGMGDTLLVANNWQPIRSTGSPFGLNYQQYCRRKNIHLQQFTDQAVLLGRRDRSLMPLPEKLRNRSLRVIEQYIQDSTTAALLDAMVLGDERNIDPDMRQVYSDTGIIHIISISGAHIAILFFVISYGFRRLTRKENHIVVNLAIISLIWFYIMIAGMPIPAIRAATMFTVLTVGNIIRRQSNSLNQLCVSALIMLLIEPMWLFSIGFQLSFAAVLSIILFYKPILSLWPVKNKMGAFLAQTIAASIAAEILVAPLVAYYFHSFPIMFIAANLVAGLVMGFILCLGMLLLLFGKISAIAHALAFIIVAVSKVFHYFIQFLNKVDVLFFKTIFISPLFLLLLYCLVASVSRLKKSRVAVWTSLCSLFLLSLLTFVRTIKVQNQRKILVFNDKRNAHVELLEETYYHLLYGTGANPSYAVNEAHIGFGANRPGNILKQNILLINGKRIVIADSTIVLTKSFPADILVIVSPSLPVSEASLLDSLAPQSVVMAAGSKYQAGKWEKICLDKKVAFHSVQAQGAFIFP